MKKRIFSLLLALILVTGIMPTAVFAEDGPVAGIGTESYATLVEAVDAAEDGDTVVLLQNAQGKGLFIDKAITLDLNGFTYTINDVVVHNERIYTHAIHIEHSTHGVPQNVTIKNGKIKDADNNNGVSIPIQNDCNLTLDNVYIDGRKNTRIGYVLSNNCGNIVIKDTTIISYESQSGGNGVAFDVYGAAEDYGDVTVTVSGNCVIDGDIYVDRNNNPSNTNRNTLIIEGGQFTGEIKGYDSSSGLTTVCIRGGDFAIAPNSEFLDANTVIVPSIKDNSTDYPYTAVLGIPADGVTLSAETAELSVGQTLDLTATVSPSDAANQNVRWSSSDSDVATVDASGKVTAVCDGTAVITAATEDRGFTAACTVTVTHGGTLVSGFAATCAADGQKDYYSCSCGKCFEDEACRIEITDLATWKVIPKIAHNSLGTVAAKEPTCTEAGVAGGTYCTACEEGKAAAEATIPMVEHNSLGSVEAKAATCTEAGIAGGTYCTACENGKAAAEASIPMAEHNSLGSVEAKAATCTEAGVVGGTYCTACENGKAAAEATIPSTGHTYGETRASDGTGHWHECSCGEKSDFADHTPGNAATATTPQTCTACGYEIAPATGTTEPGNGGSSSVSTGGGGGGGSVTPSPKEENTNVGGEVEVKVTVSGDTATVSEISAEDIAKAAGTAEAPKAVKIDLTALNNKDVSSATLSNKTLSNLAEAAKKESSGVSGVEIVLPGATVSIDADTLTAVQAQTEGKDITLAVTVQSTDELSAAQRDTVSGLTAPLVLDASFIADGKNIGDFDGGTVAVTAPYSLPAGKTAADISAYYLSDKGLLVPVTSSYNGETGEITVYAPHFSDYVISADGDPCAAFADVNRGAWYHNAADFAIINDLMGGYSDTSFGPDDKLTRAQLVTILWRSEGAPVVKDPMDFADVSADSWYTEAVRWAAANGIVSGYGDGKFGPDNSITREQLATILCRYAAFKGDDVSLDPDTNFLSWNDVFTISDWARDSLFWCIQEGIVSGVDEDTLAPRGTATRAQTAQMLMKYLGK